MTRQTILCARSFCSLLLLFSWTIVVDGDRRVSCAKNPDLMGYTSISDMNFDIYEELNSIRDDPDIDPQPLYRYTVCPGSVLDGKDRLVPALNNSEFVCGQNGQSSDECVISGGETQVLLMDWPTTIALEHVTFRGLTFADSEKFSIGAFASEATSAEFYDCHWKNGSGGSAIHNVHLSPDMLTSSFEAVATKEGDVPEISGNNVFEHNGRKLELDETVGEAEPTLIPNSGMTIRVHDSSITGGVAKDGGDYRGFYSAGRLFLKNVVVENNVGTMLTNVIGGTLSVESCRFADNTVTAAIRAIHGANVVVKDSDFVRNVAFGNVVAIGSELKVHRCAFSANTAVDGGNVLAFDKSDVNLSDSCFVQGQSLAPVFVDGSSSIDTFNNFGEGQVTGFCSEEQGILMGLKGAECILQGDVGCRGQCHAFEASQCALGSRATEIAKPSSSAGYTKETGAIGVLGTAIAALLL